MQKLARRAADSFSEENAPVSSSDIPVRRMFDDSINNTPTGAPQARGDCDAVIKHGWATNQVLRSCKSMIPKDRCSRQQIENSSVEFFNCSYKTLANGSEVDLLVSCGSRIDLASIYCKNHTPSPIPPPNKLRGFLGGIL